MKMLFYTIIVAMITSACNSLVPKKVISENDAEVSEKKEIAENPVIAEETQEIVFLNNEQIIGRLSVSVAETAEEKHRGLRYITDLPQETGMLFPFEKPRELTFVMGQVQIPLDIIFVDEKMKVLNIENAPACPDGTDEECGFYKSAGPAKYVVETNSGWSSEHQLTPGKTLLQLSPSL